jgi:hypothetical protein
MRGDMSFHGGLEPFSSVGFEYDFENDKLAATGLFQEAVSVSSPTLKFVQQNISRPISTDRSDAGR